MQLLRASDRRDISLTYRDLANFSILISRAGESPALTTIFSRVKILIFFQDVIARQGYEYPSG